MMVIWMMTWAIKHFLYHLGLTAFLGDNHTNLTLTLSNVTNNDQCWPLVITHPEN